MKLFLVLNIVLSFITRNSVNALSLEEKAEVTETCCKYGEMLPIISPDKACSIVGLPEEIEPEQIELCTSVARKCCEQQLLQKDECDAGINFALLKQFLAPKSEIVKETFQELETTTGEKNETTTAKPKEKCKANSCDHNCSDNDGKIICQCKEGYRLQPDKKSCKDINNCAETIDNLCTDEDMMYHYTEGSFKSVQIKKRDVGNSCPPGFKRNVVNQVCDDVDECATQRANCDSTEDCVNTQGGYRCNCGIRCLGGRPTSTHFHRETASSISSDSNVTTVGTQYGQRRPRYLRPTYERVHATGAVVSICPWGYKRTPDWECVDIDECGRNISECGPQQRCENFYGGYSCQCPAGYLNNGRNCDDINECGNGNNCSSNARCINTIGSYRCECSKGFRNEPSNDKVCVDVDECAKFGSHVCIAQCLNTVGSYRCTCPAGYRLADDKRSCLDINECDNGQAQCNGVGEVCTNTRGSYHCHQIKCPSGYRLDRNQCSRIQRSCPVSDRTCLQQPSTYSYNFITFVSNLYLLDSVDLFRMKGPASRDAVMSFEMRLLDVQAARGVTPADITCFSMRPTDNVCVVSMQCSLKGPQVVELELTMSLYQRSMFTGSAVAKLFIIVSEYEY